MRSDHCWIIVHDMEGRVVGCGFIPDDSHVITCSHVVGSAQGKAPGPGDSIWITSNSGQRLLASVVKDGAPAFDVCVLKRTDGQRFASTETELWARAPDRGFTGRGMNRKYPNGVPLSGTLQSCEMGSNRQFVTAVQADNRVEQARRARRCSGWPIRTCDPMARCSAW